MFFLGEMNCVCFFGRDECVFFGMNVFFLNMCVFYECGFFFF